MKTKRRQELRTNELIGELIRLRDYLQRQWRVIVGAAVVVVLIVVGMLYWRYSTAQRRAEGFKALNQVEANAERLPPLEVLDKLAAVAQQYPDHDVLQNVLDYTGYRALQAYQVAASEGPVDRDALLQRAEDAYSRMAREFADRPEVLARAHLGLAAVAEDRYDAKAAREHYEAVLNDPSLKSITMYTAIAQSRLATLDQRLEPVEILPATQPATQPTTTRATTSTAPATEPATTAMAPEVEIVPPAETPAPDATMPDASAPDTAAPEDPAPEASPSDAAPADGPEAEPATAPAAP